MTTDMLSRDDLFQRLYDLGANEDFRLNVRCVAGEYDASIAIKGSEGHAFNMDSIEDAISEALYDLERE
jgi:hypothetical protein